jgi:archaeosortase B (VPXXXP-CTERM-specific)
MFQDRQFLKIALLFFVTTIILNLSIEFFKDQLSFINIFTAWVITGLIQLSGMQATMHGEAIALVNSNWLMTTECTGIYIMGIYASFILTYPVAPRAKGIALRAGIPFIYGANIIRLYMMAWIDKLTPEYSEYFHDYLWQGVFIVMVVFMWILWIEKIADREIKTAVSR